MIRLRFLSAATALAAAGFCLPALAFEYDYSGLRGPDLLECDRMHWTGQTTRAESCYVELARSTGNPWYSAEALWAAGDIKGANDAFGRAVAVNPDDPMLRVRWGYLYMESWQYQDAVTLFEEALGIEEGYAPAEIGIARANTADFSAGGFNDLLNLLESHLGNMEAMMILARLYLEQRDIEGARVYLDTAAALLTDDLPPGRLHAYYAAASYLAGEDPEPEIQQALAVNPNDGDVFVHLAFFAEISYQYRDAVAFLQRAVQLDPYNYVARAELGLALAKLDRIEDARQHLVQAFEGDPYNIETSNLLKLIDTLDEFQVVERPLTYETSDGLQSTTVRLRLHRDESPVMAPYTFELLERAIPTFVERYDFQPAEAIAIELYPHHDDFAVRTLGEPMIGPLGITFGYLFAMDSPSAKPPGSFHWGSVLWHELSHVFTLEASGSRVPRWFSEGLSTYEEWNTGPLNRYQIPAYVFQRIGEGRMLSVRDLDGGFLRQEYDNQIIVSYQQAGLICQFIADTWGSETFARMLAEFKQRKDLETVFEEVLGVNTFAFDARFEDWVFDEFGQVINQADALLGYLGEASQAYAAEDWQAVIDNANRALIIYPEYTEDGNAYEPLGRTYQELGDLEAELEVLRQYHRQGGYAPGALNRLVELLQLEGADDEALAVLRDLRFVAPFPEKLHRELAQGYADSGDTENALLEYSILLDTGVQDIASVHYGIARQHLQAGRNELARRHTLLALETAPYYREAQNLLLEIMQRDL